MPPVENAPEKTVEPQKTPEEIAAEAFVADMRGKPLEEVTAALCAKFNLDIEAEYTKSLPAVKNFVAKLLLDHIKTQTRVMEKLYPQAMQAIYGRIKSIAQEDGSLEEFYDKAKQELVKVLNEPIENKGANSAMTTGPNPALAHQQYFIDYCDTLAKDFSTEGLKEKAAETVSRSPFWRFVYKCLGDKVPSIIKSLEDSDNFASKALHHGLLREKNARTKETLKTEKQNGQNADDALQAPVKENDAPSPSSSGH